MARSKELLDDKSVMTHGQLVAWCVSYLNSLGHYAWINQTGGVFKRGRYIPFGKKGSADVFCQLPRGRMLYAEVKIGKDALNEDQLEFRKEVVNRNALWIEVRGIDDLVAYCLKNDLTEGSMNERRHGHRSSTGQA
jgi:hypothetical protein